MAGKLPEVKNRMLSRATSSIALLALATSLAATGCSENRYYRANDPYYHDHHRWDDREAGYYAQWEREEHREHHEYRQLKKDEQKKYWDWRHSHDHDHDHDRDDRK
jgi:hypothetical protein